MTTLSPYFKAVYAFLGTTVGALTTAIAATPHQSFRDLGTLGWLLLTSTILGVPAVVYGVSNASVLDKDDRLPALITGDSSGAVKAFGDVIAAVQRPPDAWPPPAGDPPITS